jgi:hypothetical protein
MNVHTTTNGYGYVCTCTAIMVLLWEIMAGLSINKDRILLPANGKILKGVSEEQCKDVFPVSHKYGFVPFLNQRFRDFQK